MVVVVGDGSFFHLLLVVGIVMRARALSGHVLLRVQVNIEQGPFMAWLLPTGLAAAVEDLLHQLVDSGNLIIAWAVQRHLDQKGTLRESGS